jgi:hypothetical protein
MSYYYTKKEGKTQSSFHGETKENLFRHRFETTGANRLLDHFPRFLIQHLLGNQIRKKSPLGFAVTMRYIISTAGLFPAQITTLGHIVFTKK